MTKRDEGSWPYVHTVQGSSEVLLPRLSNGTYGVSLGCEQHPVVCWHLERNVASFRGRWALCGRSVK